MPNTPHLLLCRYHYDPLDRLAGRSVADQAGEQCFYLKNRLTTEIQGQIQYSRLQTPDQLLAQQRRDNSASDCALIATDLPGSVIHGIASDGRQTYAYAPYGSRHPQHDALHLPGFNRERADPVTGHYLLGNGYRAFNPVLMRFNSPDSLSPFGAGGLNAYGYCVGDPVNRVDPGGHMFKQLRALFSPQPPKSTTPFKLLGEGLISFEKISKTRRTLVISGHGSDAMMEDYHPVVTLDFKARRPGDVYEMAQKVGVDLKDFDRVRVMTCHSADGGENSFAAQLSRITNKPVKGYKGKIYVNGPQATSSELASKTNKIRKLSDTTYEYQGPIWMHKKNPSFIWLPNTSSFAYEPVIFNR